MKKTLLALSLVACLLLTFAACGDGEIESEYKDNQYVNPTETTNGTDDNTTEDNGGTTTAGNLQEGGANTEEGWGPIHTVG